MSTQVTLRGNLVRDPEMRYSNAGKPVTKFTVITSRRFKNPQTEEWEDRDVDNLSLAINWRDKSEPDFAISPIRGIINGTARCANTKRSLTHSLDLGEEGLVMHASQSQSAADISAELLAQVGIAGRFWRNVDKNGPVPEHRPELGNCWVWTLRVSRGYGRITIRGQFYFAHRLSWLLAGREISEDKPFVLHRCDNRRCVRLDHLFLGTADDNTRDMMSKGRWDGGRSRDGDHEGETHVCVACGRRRRDKGRGLCGGCHESNRIAGTLDRYPLRRKQAAA